MRPIAGRGTAERGFTLIELSVVLVIIGILLAAILPIYENYIESSKRKQLEATLGTVRTALVDFIIDDGADTEDSDEIRFPCPAPLDAPIGSATYGLEQCGLASAGIGTCSNGVCVREGAPGKKVLVGAVPTRTLAVPGANMFDPYGNRITYAVSADLVAPHSMENLTTSGGVRIIDDGGTVTNSAQFALISHGRDGAGSYTAGGVLNGNPCRATTQGDAENCNNDATFRVNEGETSADTAQFYDDRAEFTLVHDQDDQWWRQADPAGLDIVNRNPRNVGVGFTVGAPAQKFDVNGNIRSRMSIMADLDVTAARNVVAANDVNAGNNVTAAASISAGQYISAGIDITAGNSIAAHNDVVAGRNILGNNNAYIQKDVSIGNDLWVGRHIVAQGNITAGLDLQAVHNVRATDNIHAGQNVYAKGFYYNN